MKFRYTKAERLRKSAAETVLSDPAATSADRMAAVRTLERLESAAQRRQKDQPAPPPPSVDDLVSALERTEKRPLQPIENKGEKNGLNPIEAILTPPSRETTPSLPPNVETAVIESDEEKARQEKALQAVQDIADGKQPLPVLEPIPPVQKCWNCDKPGQPTWDDRVLCPAHFTSEASRQAREAATARLADPPDRNWLYGKGTDENTFDLSAAHGSSRTSDFARSVALWEVQAREDADRREQEAAERVRLEAEVNRRRAEWIQNGGKI